MILLAEYRTIAELVVLLLSDHNDLRVVLGGEVGVAVDIELELTLAPPAVRLYAPVHIGSDILALALFSRWIFGRDCTAVLPSLYVIY